MWFERILMEVWFHLMYLAGHIMGGVAAEYST